MSSPVAVSPDLRVFLARLSQRQASRQEQLTRVGLHLVDGALRVRRGGDGVYENVERPITKPAEAIGEWLRGLDEATAIGGVARTHEAREAVAAAAEELDQATMQSPATSRLRNALYADALGALGADTQSTLPATFWPWMVASSLAGILIGLFLGRRR
jgi:hypothetical protein